MGAYLRIAVGLLLMVGLPVGARGYGLWEVWIQGMYDSCLRDAGASNLNPDYAKAYCRCMTTAFDQQFTETERAQAMALDDQQALQRFLSQRSERVMTTSWKKCSQVEVN